MSHPVPGQEYYCEECFQDLEEGGHICLQA